MSSDRRLEAWFAAAKDLSPEEQAVFIERECRDAPTELREQIARLLAADRECQQSPTRSSHPPVTPSATSESDDEQPSEAIRESIAAPRHIARYRVERVLGSGGFGFVFLAFDDQLDRQVVIKVPHPRLASDPEAIEAHRAEAKAVAKLDHPAIVPVYDVGGTPDFPCFFVSKYIDGMTLAERLRRSPLTHRESAQLLITVADALHSAHKLGLVHRDIKPANILTDDKARPYLVDFGIALQDKDVGRGPAYVGTPAYMSPEQARGEGHRVDGRSDIFSLGIVFYEMLCGRRPFYGRTSRELFDEISRCDVRPPRQCDDTIPAELERICLKALSRKITERYTTAKDIADDLRAYLTDAPAVATTARITSAPPASDTPAAGHTPTPHTTPLPTRVVPKGLRSFDDKDEDFFLELLPGPRDRNGLPDSIRFWKNRVEATDSSLAFSVGLLYGPSGCGKTSLVRAGLLTRLASWIMPVYVEAAGRDTEARILASLRRQVPDLPSQCDLIEALSLLRKGRFVRANCKVLIVIDQFEQWLNERQEPDREPLTQALRQCDGERVQCLILVRDDFWLAISRFMQALEVPLYEHENSDLVDLFDCRHAERVLEAFGRAYGALPSIGEPLAEQQSQFIKLAVSTLADREKVISVRLALFAEMMKEKLWIPATLRALGGIDNVAVAFLEEMFESRTASPRHRVHAPAAHLVLERLLPALGSDITGQARSKSDLLTASGYESEPARFEELIAILDRELRLVTPTQRSDVSSSAAESESSSNTQYYKLTHDYLVPALREWLTRKRRETAAGRAELRLAAREAIWSAQPETRHLPSLFEFVTGRVFTKPRNWSDLRRRMMRGAAILHARRAAVSLGLFGIMVALAMYGRKEYRLQRQTSQARLESAFRLFDGWTELVQDQDYDASRQQPIATLLEKMIAEYDLIAEYLSDDPLPVLKQGRARTKLASVYNRMDLDPRALITIQDALTYFDRVLTNPEWSAVHDLATLDTINARLLTADLVAGDVPQATQLLTQSIDDAQRLLTLKSPPPKSRDSLIIGLYKKSILLNEADPVQSAKLADEAARHAQNLVDENVDDARSQEILAAVRIWLAGRLRQRGQEVVAINEAALALDAYEALCRLEPEHFQHRANLGTALLEHAEALLALGRQNDAQFTLRQALEQWDRLQGTSYQELYCQQQRAATQVTLAKCLLTLGETIEAEQLAVDASALLQEIVAAYPYDALAKNDAAVARSTLGQIQLERNKVADARSSIEIAVKQFEALEPTPDARLRLAIARSWLADAVARGTDESAESEAGRLFSLASGELAVLVSDHPELPAHLHAAAQVDERYGEWLMEWKEESLAAERFAAAEASWKRLVANHSTPDRIAGYAEFLLELAPSGGEQAASALELTGAAVRDEPRNLRLKTAHAQALIAHADLDEARSLLASVAESGEPETIRGQLLLAQVEARQDDHGGAATRLKSATALLQQFRPGNRRLEQLRRLTESVLDSSKTD